MADNVGYTPGTGATVSADEVTYSGDTSLVQLVRPVLTTGAEGSRTVVELTGDATNGLDVDVTRLPALPTGSNTIGTVVVSDGTHNISIDNAQSDGESNSANSLHTSARHYLFNGTTWDRARGDITNGLDVDVTRVGGNVTVVQSTAANLNATVTGTVTANAGTGNFTVTQATASNLKTDANITNASVTVAQATAANLNATVTGTVTANAGTGSFTVAQATAANLNATVTVSGIADVEGGVAHDAVDSGNPLKVGTRARSTVITSVASDDRADAIGTLQGYVITYPYALPQSALTGTASSTGTGDTAVIAAQGAGITINVTTITVYNDSTTNTFVNIKDGATTRLVVPAPAKGGAMITLPSPLRITANTAFNFASNAGVTTMYVSAVGFAGI